MKNETIKKVLSTVGNYAKVGIVVASPYVLSKASKKLGDYIADKMAIGAVITYEDAARVILNSDMLGSQKKETLGLLQRGKDKEYYRLVARVIESVELGSTKIDMIKEINVNEGEES